MTYLIKKQSNGFVSRTTSVFQGSLKAFNQKFKNEQGGTSRSIDKVVEKLNKHAQNTTFTGVTYSEVDINSLSDVERNNIIKLKEV